MTQTPPTPDDVEDVPAEPVHGDYDTDAPEDAEPDFDAEETDEADEVFEEDEV